MKKLKDWLDLIRPFTLVAPAIGFFGAGIIAWSTLQQPFSAVMGFIAIGSLSAALLNGASNSLNQVFDVEVDKINKPERPLPSGRLSKRQAALITICLYFISFILAWFVSPEGSRQYFFMAVAAAGFTFIYSAPPLRTKRYPWISNMTIALPRGMLPVAGWSAVRSIADAEPWAIGIVFTIFLIGAASTKDFSDVKGDLMYGCKTLPATLGAAKSTRVIAPFFSLPWLLIIPFSYLNLLTGNRQLLIIISLGLFLWGLYISFLLIKEPGKLATEKNHVSWKHMYLLMICAYLGITVSYLSKLIF